MDQQMLEYIINDAVDDFQDTIDGVKELARVFQDEKLEHIVRQLNEYKTYVGNLKRKTRENWNKPRPTLIFHNLLATPQEKYDLLKPFIGKPIKLTLKQMLIIDRYGKIENEVYPAGLAGKLLSVNQYYITVNAVGRDFDIPYGIIIKAEAL